MKNQVTSKYTIVVKIPSLTVNFILVISPSKLPLAVIVVDDAVEFTIVTALPDTLSHKYDVGEPDIVLAINPPFAVHEAGPGGFE